MSLLRIPFVWLPLQPERVSLPVTFDPDVVGHRSSVAVPPKNPVAVHDSRVEVQNEAVE